MSFELGNNIQHRNLLVLIMHPFRIAIQLDNCCSLFFLYLGYSSQDHSLVVQLNLKCNIILLGIEIQPDLGVEQPP